jgi:hypothetical protein
VENLICSWCGPVVAEYILYNYKQHGHRLARSADRRVHQITREHKAVPALREQETPKVISSEEDILSSLFSMEGPSVQEEIQDSL